MEERKATNERILLGDISNTTGQTVRTNKHKKFLESTIFDYWASLEADPCPIGPMGRLLTAMKSKSQVIVMTRGMREIRALVTGKLVAFDRYWNLILDDVTEYSIHLKKTALISSSGPGRKRRKRQRRIRKCLEKAGQQQEQVNKTPSTSISTKNLDDTLWDLSISPTDEIDAIYDDDCCRVFDDPQPSTSEAACLADCPMRMAPEGGSLWTASLVQMTMGCKGTPNEQKPTWSRVFHEQLFIRGSNIVTVRVVDDSTTSQD